MNTHNSQGSQKRLYYGWIIVGVSLISTSFWLGIRSGFSVFYVALLNDFSWNRGESAGVQSLAMIMYTLLAPLAGGLIDKFGPRRVIVPGILVLSLGLILSSLINDLLQFYLIYGILVGGGITSIGIVTYSAIIAHWFDKKRGLASGIALSGMGLGTFVLVPFTQYAILTWGWRSTFVILAGMVIIVLIPLNGILLRHKPGDLGLLPDGINEPACIEVSDETACSQIVAIDWTLAPALRTKSFWALFAFSSLAIIGIYFVLVHNVKFMVDHGIDKMTAAYIFALVGVISSVFRIVWGWLSDRIGREITYSMGMSCAIIGLLSLLLMELLGDNRMIYPFFIFFGMGWGVSAPMFMAVAADLFRGRGFGLIYGIVEAGIGVAGAFGAWMGGYIYDQTQSYQGAIILSIIVMTLSGVCIWIAAPHKARLKN